MGVGKEVLESYIKIKNEIKYLKLELMRLKSMLNPSGFNASDVRVKGGKKKKHEDINIDIIAIEKRLGNLESIADSMKIKILDRLAEMECDEVYKLILHKRYLLIQSWKAISKDMNYSRTQLWRLHEEALSYF